jgi:phosphohistidine phosphatase
MLDLYLVRHAFAGHADPARWPDDADRPVTAEGDREFRAAAAGLRRLVPVVEVVLSSRFARAWQTAHALHEVTGWPEARECRELEVGRPPRGVVDLLHERMQDSIALVGHEPQLSSLVSLLSTGDEGALNLKLKKGAAVCVRFPGPVEPGAGILRWAVEPRILQAVDDAVRA